MNNESDSKPHTFLRIGIVLLVIAVVIGSVMIMENKNENTDLDFKYVDAKVVWKNDMCIEITFGNVSNIYNIRVICEDEDTDHEVILSKSTISGTNNITFDLTDMIDDDMAIWIEVENATIDVKETIRWA